MRDGFRVRLAIVGLGLALAVGIAAPGTGQESAGGGGASPMKVLHHRGRSFRIPITVAPNQRARIHEVRLYSSTDAGLSWELSGRTTPEEPYFNFKAPRDAEYWFAVRTLDTQGRSYPPDDRPAVPMLKVVVDTVPPTVVLEPRNRKGSLASVHWEVKDEHLALDTLTLESQAGGEADWTAIPLRAPALIGAETWDAGTANRLKVRLTVKDKAGNVGSAEVELPDGIARDPGPAEAAESDDFAAPPPIVPISERAAPRRSATNPEDDGFTPAEDLPPPARGEGFARPSQVSPAPTGRSLLVGSPQFPLQYEVEDAGPNGPALVELWVTQNGGRTWRRLPEDADHASPYQVDLGGEGTFGLWLVVQGASSLGDPPPAPGDPPQMWVEVDSTPPSVRLDTPRVGVGQRAGQVLITWQASDPHLARKPVFLTYRADSPDAKWQPITPGRIENTGKFIWKVPPGVPPRVHVRIDVVDSLGNRGSAETTDTGRPVVIDRARPKGRIIGLDPSARALGADERRR